MTAAPTCYRCGGSWGTVACAPYSDPPLHENLRDCVVAFRSRLSAAEAALAVAVGALEPLMESRRLDDDIYGPMCAECGFGWGECEAVCVVGRARAALEQIRGSGGGVTRGSLPSENVPHVASDGSHAAGPGGSVDSVAAAPLSPSEAAASNPSQYAEMPAIGNSAGTAASGRNPLKSPVVVEDCGSGLFKVWHKSTPETPWEHIGNIYGGAHQKGQLTPKMLAYAQTLGVTPPGPASSVSSSPAAEGGEAGYVDIVFDGLPGPDGPRFIECENEARQSIRLGEWVTRDDGFAALRIPRAIIEAPADHQSAAEHRMIHGTGRSEGGTA